MSRFVIVKEIDIADPLLSDEALYWNEAARVWGPLPFATVYLDTHDRLPDSVCYWTRLPEPRGNELVISNDPNANWQDNLVQFARLIAELESEGIISDMCQIRPLLESMDLAPESFDELVERAVKFWDGVKSQMKRPKPVKKAKAKRRKK